MLRAKLDLLVLSFTAIVSFPLIFCFGHLATYTASKIRSSRHLDGRVLSPTWTFCTCRDAPSLFLGSKILRQNPASPRCPAKIRTVHSLYRTFILAALLSPEWLCNGANLAVSTFDYLRMITARLRDRVRPRPAISYSPSLLPCLHRSEQLLFPTLQ
jgi:hypothetical protein